MTDINRLVCYHFGITADQLENGKSALCAGARAHRRELIANAPAPLPFNCKDVALEIFETSDVYDALTTMRYTVPQCYEIAQDNVCEIINEEFELCVGRAPTKDELSDIFDILLGLASDKDSKSATKRSETDVVMFSY